jgi:hypothetical protein
MMQSGFEESAEAGKKPSRQEAGAGGRSRRQEQEAGAGGRDCPGYKPAR